MKKILTALAFLFLISIATVNAIELGNPIEYQSLKARVIITGNGTISGETSQSDEITLKVLVPKETEMQKVSELNAIIAYSGKTISPSFETDEFENRFAVFKLANIKEPNFDYEITALVETNSQTGLIDHNHLFPITQFSQFALETEHIESDDESIQSIAQSFSEKESELEIIRKITEWTHNYVVYDENYWNGTWTAKQVLENKKGVCDEYSNLAAALLRAKGIPVKIVSGIVYSGKKWDNHSWLKAFIPNYGWINLDPTYSEAGFVDSTHIELGSTNDRSSAKDQSMLLPEKLNVEVKDNRTIEAIEAKKFSGIIELKQLNDFNDFKSQEIVDLNFSIKNKTNSKIIIPIQLQLHESFSENEKENLVLLSPLEEKKLNYKKMTPDTNGKSYLYEFRFSSIENSIDSNIIVKPNPESKTKPFLKIEQITPTIQQNNDIIVEIIILNSGSADGAIKTTLSNNSMLKEFPETIPKKTKLSLKYNAEKAALENKLTAKIEGENLNYTEEISIIRKQKKETTESSKAKITQPTNTVKQQSQNNGETEQSEVSQPTAAARRQKEQANTKTQTGKISFNLIQIIGISIAIIAALILMIFLIQKKH